MIATAKSQYASTSYPTWHDSIPHTTRPYSKSNSSDRSTITNHSLISSDAGPSTTLTSPVDCAMSASSSLVSLAGKKRKRLQRACVACHKAKRRCDGGLPCSNCDFSGRSCAYSDAQGKAVPPTKRTLKPSEVALHGQDRQHHVGHGDMAMHTTVLPSSASTSSTSHYSPPSYGAQQSLPVYGNSRYSPITQQPSRSSGPSHGPRYDQGFSLPLPYNSPRSSMPAHLSLEARRELLHIFVDDLQPWSCSVHEATLFRSLSTHITSSPLLAAVYALSAQHTYLESKRISPHSARYSSFASLLSEVGDGTSWAEEARRALYQQDESTGLSSIDGDISPDTAQTLVLLAYFEHAYRRIETAAAYIRVASKFVAEQCTSLEVYRGDAETFAQRKQLIALIALLDMAIGVTSGRGSSLRVWELESAVGIVEKGSEDDDWLTSSLVQQLKTVLIFCGAHEAHSRAAKLALRSKSRAPALETASTSHHARACEAYLQSWADALPGRLRFDEQSLHRARQAFHPEANMYGHSNAMTPSLIWSGVHLCAEAAILLLQDATETDLSLAAAQNMAMILEIIPPAALRGPLGTFGIALLKAAAATGERAASRRLSSTSEGTGIATRKPWIDLEQTSEALAREAHCSMWMSPAVKSLSLGYSQDGMSADRPRELPQRSTMSSWAMSPSHAARPALSRVSSTTRGPQAVSDERQALPPLLRARSTSGGRHEVTAPRQAEGDGSSGNSISDTRSPITLPPLRFGMHDGAKPSTSPWRGMGTSIAASDSRYARD